MSNWNVGDEIVVEEPSFRGAAKTDTFVVTRVARKYFRPAGITSLGVEVEIAFEINTGIEKQNGSKKRRDELDERLSAHTVQFSYSSIFGGRGHKLTDPELSDILAILDRAHQRITSNEVRP